MSLLIGALTIGLIFSLLAMGVLISFRILAFRDLTVDGSMTLGGAVAGMLIAQGVSPVLSTLSAIVCGAIAGSVTGVLATRLKINGLLAGILVMTALYSVNLRVMGKSNIPLMNQMTLFSSVQSLAQPEDRWGFLVWQAPTQDVYVLLLLCGMIPVVALLVWGYFQTEHGLAMRATGDNSDMIRALGVNVDWMTVTGLGLSNGLVALSGAMLVQYQGFADVQMGIGMVVWGFASVIIGESLVRSRSVGLLLTGAVMGSLLFRLLVAIALRWGLNPNDLKLVTALFVLAALVLPMVLARVSRPGQTQALEVAPDA